MMTLGLAPNISGRKRNRPERELSGCFAKISERSLRARVTNASEGHCIRNIELVKCLFSPNARERRNPSWDIENPVN